ncbi:type 1 glutamine amidotransferase [Defluviimonas sp. WL0002]|uniref:Type 1 glutamine amidotransferase n=1 Tax=Albidovulum marisflavi TaxID=2984159 RepID=A0ABT2ZGL5_9RHOB|nr:type 1 glutamine amidotransferase domain-containing protein [Defluviimonas sp. WL0002]MCV2870259.1 type 1 glutamine amidotransferase [Defluviimonas sp. WL0002]
MPKIDKARVLVIATDGFEQSELEVPVDELKKRGAEVWIASPDGNDIRGWKNGDWGQTVSVNASIGNVREAAFDALVLPGGQINPDVLRTKPEAVQLVRDFHDAGKAIAAICHGPWLLIEADVVKVRDETSYESIATDMKNAGANWKDAEVVVDQAIITSRSPADLGAFVGKIVEEIEEGPHKRDAA